MAAAIMDGAILRSPSIDTDVTSDADVDARLLAEERNLHKRRRESEKAEMELAVCGTPSDSDDDTAVHPQVAKEEGMNAKQKLMELVGKSQMYSDFLAEEFKDLVEKTLAKAAGDGQAEEQRPAKKAKKGRGKKAQPLSATQRLLPLIKADLRDYQLKGVAWLISLYTNGVNGILADEMGLGKTLQTISFISYVYAGTAQATPGKFLVVGPLSTLSNWVAEFERFCPDIPVLLYHGTPQEREQLRRQHMSVASKEQMPVIITSYEIIIADRRHLERHNWKVLVVDEGHRLKNFDCKLIRELRTLNTQNRLLLTGTPLQNNLKELWSLLSFCMPNIFSNVDQFLDWFNIANPAPAIPAAVAVPRRDRPSESGTGSTVSAVVDEPEAKRKGRGRRKVAAKKTVAGNAAAGGSAQAATDPAAVDEGLTAATMVSRLHAILKPFMLRRVKADVNIGVPPKQEIVLYAEMTEEQRRLTKGLIDGTLNDELAKDAQPGVRVNRLNNLIMQMRKVCNHPDLITGQASGSSAYPPASELVAQCGKLALLDRLLKELLKGGHKVLIFSQMTELLNVIEAYLADMGIEALRIDGSIPWQQRKESIAQFQDVASTKRVFLLSTRAGGLGINLTAADTVIIYDSDWNPHQDSQAMDRCHRIGQTKPVLVFRLVTSNSVENRMLAKAESKKALERIVIKKGAFKELLQTTSSTSADELLQLLNPDRRSGDLAQSGVVSDDILRQLLDRSHLMPPLPQPVAAAEAGPGPSAAAAGGKQARGGKRGGKAAKDAAAAAPAAAAPAAPSGSEPPVGPAPPPYPLVGVGYEVVVDEPRRAVGLLNTIEGDVGEAEGDEGADEGTEEQVDE
ncbi:hypothetical protein GPECTOR_3g239 [Gonium pectorale]|uniref:Uncharacterized protein n=1 Tax=Gonium pectorale TaxID=33097 RepID=A0A150GZA8_GONPE|nr:hypothetical protein GPECTOR_3g239 [Gonium pectorale]|eukprot:KXZ55083.1 hypothetical protein GPECTOR_3g239 [Gonium pectorale]